MRRIAMAAICMTLVVAAGACSQGKKSWSGPTTTAARPATTVARAAGANPFCDFVGTFNDRFGRVNLGLTDPQQLKAVLQDATAAIAGAQAIAPPAIKADVVVLNDAF